MEIQDKLSLRKYDKNFTPEKQIVTFTIDEAIIGTLQSIVCIQGIPKAGKSLITTSAIASAYMHTDLYGLRINRPEAKNKIVFFDTESSDYDFYHIMERIKKQTYLNNIPDTLDAFNFREDRPQDIIQMIETYLSLNDTCGIVVIDGVLDLIADYNDVKESFYLINWFKSITKKFNVMLVMVLHEGKTANNSIGHIGSFIDRKSQSVISVKKNTEIDSIEVTAKFLRMSKDFEPIHIKHNGTEWYRHHIDDNIKNEMNQNEMDTIVYRLLAGRELTYQQLCNDISERLAKSSSTAKRIVKEQIERNKIIKRNNVYVLK